MRVPLSKRINRTAQALLASCSVVHVRRRSGPNNHPTVCLAEMREDQLPSFWHAPVQQPIGLVELLVHRLKTHQVVDYIALALPLSNLSVNTESQSHAIDNKSVTPTINHSSVRARGGSPQCGPTLVWWCWGRLFTTMNRTINQPLRPTTELN